MKFSHAYTALENEMLEPDLRTLLAGWRRFSDPDVIKSIVDANLTSTVPMIREAAVRLAPLPSPLLEQALNDTSDRVRAAAVGMNNLSPAQFDRALADPSRHVRLAAVEHGGLNPVQMQTALLDDDYLVRWAAIEAGHVPDVFLGFLSQDDAWQVRAGALALAAETRRLDPAILNRALDDAHSLVRRIAQDIANTIPSLEMDQHPTAKLGKQLASSPLAAPGLTSYRYPGKFGHVMIGAKDHDDALTQARRSSPDASKEKLEVWDGKEYVPCYVKPQDQAHINSQDVTGDTDEETTSPRP